MLARPTDRSTGLTKFHQLTQSCLNTDVGENDTDTTDTPPHVFWGRRNSSPLSSFPWRPSKVRFGEGRGTTTSRRLHVDHRRSGDARLLPVRQSDLSKTRWRGIPHCMSRSTERLSRMADLARSRAHCRQCVGNGVGPDALLSDAPFFHALVFTVR